MANWVSRRGVWHPAKEKVGLNNYSGKEITAGDGEKIKPGEPYIYDGPDRSALFELFQAKQETLGVDFKNDPDLIARVRQLGYKDVDDYAKAMGYDDAAAEQEFQKKAATVTKHELPKRVAAIKQLGGGRDFSGSGDDAYGGFGQPKDLPGKE